MSSHQNRRQPLNYYNANVSVLNAQIFASTAVSEGIIFEGYIVRNPPPPAPLEIYPPTPAKVLCGGGYEKGSKNGIFAPIGRQNVLIFFTNVFKPSFSGKN